MDPEFPSRLTFVGELRSGRTIEARWIVRHPMDSGLRVDDSGQRIPRNIIEQVSVRVNGVLVLDIEPGTGLSANPYLAFPLVVSPQACWVQVDWRDDRGRQGRTEQRLVPVV